MPGWDEVRAIAGALPEVGETRTYGGVSWKVKGKLFAWERPLTAKDRAALGDDAPDGELLGLRTDGQAGKQALLATAAPAVFTIPHFEGYSAVLVRLEIVEADVLAELIVDAWLVQAPKKLAKAYLERG